jgi:hypothetical protein
MEIVSLLIGPGHRPQTGLQRSFRASQDFCPNLARVEAGPPIMLERMGG